MRSGCCRWRRASFSRCGPRAWLFAWFYLVDARPHPGGPLGCAVLRSSIPLWCLLAASGALVLARAVAGLDGSAPCGRGPSWPRPPAGRGAPVFVARARCAPPPEIAAARKEAAFLQCTRARRGGARGHHVYWSVLRAPERPPGDRGRADFDAVSAPEGALAALPTRGWPSSPPAIPGALPRSLVYDHADGSTDVTVFSVHPEAQP